jgi:L-threonylcarbamoyladenylate synthase
VNDRVKTTAIGHHDHRIRLRLADDASVAEAGALLRAGHLVGLPTETVYGLAADATSAAAVLRIYETKHRPRFNPLIVHVATLAEAERHGVFGAGARKLAATFWPGPLTLVLPFRTTSPVADLVRAGLDTIALRIPGHEIARAIIAAADRPIAAPSANRSGRISPTRAQDVLLDLGEAVSLIVDGGACSIGLESTVVACLGDDAQLLRPGGLPRADIERVLGRPLHAPDMGAAPRAPGLLASHYAPDAALRMDASAIEPGEALLSFGAAHLPGAEHAVATVNLSPTGRLDEAACRLFAALRALDAHKPRMIAVMPIPTHGLGEAINDRLARAAAPRPHGLNGPTTRVTHTLTDERH